MAIPTMCGFCQSPYVETRAKGPHVEAFCGECGRHLAFVSKVDAGLKTRTIQTTHAAIKPKTRAKILERATSRCEICGRRDGILHVSHLLSVDAGHAAGLTDEEINCDENLASLCEECNIGMGRSPVPLRLAIAIIRARLK